MKYTLFCTLALWSFALSVNAQPIQMSANMEETVGTSQIEFIDLLANDMEGLLQLEVDSNLTRAVVVRFQYKKRPVFAKAQTIQVSIADTNFGRYQFEVKIRNSKKQYLLMLDTHADIPPGIELNVRVHCANFHSDLIRTQ